MSMHTTELNDLLAKVDTVSDEYVMQLQVLHTALQASIKRTTQDNNHRTITLSDGGQLVFRDWGKGQYELSVFTAEWVAMHVKVKHG